MDTTISQSGGFGPYQRRSNDPFAKPPVSDTGTARRSVGAASGHVGPSLHEGAASVSGGHPQVSEAQFLQDYEQRADVLLKRYYDSHPNVKKTITAKMFAEAAREILDIYKDIDRILPVEIPFAQLICEGGLRGAERTKGNVFNVGETDAGGHINKDGSEIAYIEGFKAYYRLIAKRYLDEKTPSQLLEKGSFTNGAGTQGGSYAANTLYESQLKAEIGKMYIADSGFQLSGSVGKNGANKPDDVLVVGKMLAEAGFLPAADVADAEKVGHAILRFQKEAILPDEESDWHARRISAIKGKGKEDLPDDSSQLSGAAVQSMADINQQKRGFQDGLISPRGQTLGVLYYMSKMGNKVDHQGAAADGGAAGPAGAAEVSGGVGPSRAPAGAGRAQTSLGRITVGEHGLNVRAAPSLSGAKLGVLRPGAQATSVGQRGGWYQIQYQGQLAFVSGLEKYVSFQPLERALHGGTREPPEGAAGSLLGGLAGAVEDLATDATRALGEVFDWLKDTPSGADAGAGAEIGAGAGARAGARAGADAAVGAPPADALLVRRGELTMQGEGSDAQTRYIHWPHTEASGVTLGKGYDIGSRSAAQVVDELTAAGMSQEQAVQISRGAGRKGSDAAAFVAANKAAVGEIAREVQYNLLATMLTAYTEKARHTATDQRPDAGDRNAAGREKKLGLSRGALVLSAQEWQNLHPALVEFLTDLIYQGGYYGYDRVAKINAALKAHDGDALAQLEAVRGLFADAGDQESYMDRYAAGIGEHAGRKGSRETFYGQTVDLEGEFRRNQLRIAYLDHVIAAMRAGKSVVVVGGGPGGAPPGGRVEAAGSPSGATGEHAAPKAQSPAPAAHAGSLTLLTDLNVRATPGADGQRLGGLSKGATVPFVERAANGWYQIQYQGAAAFITGSPSYVQVQTSGKESGAGARRASESGAQEGGRGESALQHIYRALGHLADEAKDLLDEPGGGEGGARKDAGDTPLAQLLAQDRLTPEQLAEARAEVAKLPPAERPKYYLQLQSKPAYQNQRDNATAKEKVKGGGTCNLTSVAMCLEYLGIPSPHPELAYDEALIKLALDQGFSDLTSHETWRKVTAKLGVGMSTIQSGGQKAPRSFWESNVRDKHLGAGHSVLCSLDGHIVRVQAATDSGLVVDDPFGASRLTAGGYGFDKKNRGKDGADAKNDANEGEDHAWSWQEVEVHTFGFIYAFSR